MADESSGKKPTWLNIDIDDPEFQKKWREARTLDTEQVETAFFHGFWAGDRFAERPFREIEDYLRESWEGMGPPAPWDQVRDIVESGYRRAEGGGNLGQHGYFPPGALQRFPNRTIGGSNVGGTVGDTNELGAAERAPEFDGEGGPPVGGHEEASGPDQKPPGATRSEPED